MENPRDALSSRCERARALADQGEVEESYRELERVYPLFLMGPFEAGLFPHYLMGTIAFRTSRFRVAIEHLRSALQTEEDPLTRSRIYLLLCRLYRIEIRMRHARLELERAFKAINAPYPFPGFFPLIKSVGVWLLQSARRRTVEPRVDPAIRHRVDLYLEAGLSSYYQREWSPMLQCVLRVRDLVKRVGPGREMIDWLGGAAVVLALLRLQDRSRATLRRIEDLANAMGDRNAQARVLIWKGLALDYLGDPRASIECFRHALDGHVGDIDLNDAAMVCPTMACNLVLRGKMKEALHALDFLNERMNRSVRAPAETVEQWEQRWYALPALTRLGKGEPATDILARANSVFSSSDHEKWRVAQYLGNVLLHYYFRDDIKPEDVDNICARFAFLKMTPSGTHLEACHYWVARAYAACWFYERDPSSRREFDRALRDLAKTPVHPSLRAHLFVLTSRLHLAESGESEAAACLVKAEKLAETTDNDWVRYEVYRARRRARLGNSDEWRAKAETIARDQGWKS